MRAPTRPTLASESSYLSHLLGERQGLARERQRMVIGDAVDRQEALEQVDAWRDQVDQEIRTTRAQTTRLRAGKAA